MAFERIRGLGDNDAEVGRRAISLVARLADAIGDGFTIAAIPADAARFADATPELTNAVAPERRYRHLVRVLDYASKNEALLASEAAEERRRVELALASARR